MKTAIPAAETLIPKTQRARDVVPLAVPELRGNEWQYIKECLDTGWVSSVGSYVDRFAELAPLVRENVVDNFADQKYCN
jgi:hypothetical protein